MTPQPKSAEAGQEMHIGHSVWTLVLDAKHRPKEFVRVLIIDRDGQNFTTKHANGYTEKVLHHALSWHPNARLTVGVRP